MASEQSPCECYSYYIIDFEEIFCLFIIQILEVEKIWTGSLKQTTKSSTTKTQKYIMRSFISTAGLYELCRVGEGSIR